MKKDHAHIHSLTRLGSMTGHHSFPNNVHSFYSIHSKVVCCCCCFIFDLVVCGCIFVCLYCTVYTGEVHILFMLFHEMSNFCNLSMLLLACARVHSPAHASLLYPSIVQHQPFVVGDIYLNKSSIIIIIGHTPLPEPHTAGKCNCRRIFIFQHSHSLLLHSINALHGATATK